MGNIFTVGSEGAEFTVEVDDTNNVVTISLSGIPLPLPMYIQEDDPGAVGASRPWLVPSTGVLQYRNGENDDWIAVAGGGTTQPTEPTDDPGPVPVPTIINMDAAGAASNGTTDNSNLLQNVKNAAPAGAVFQYGAGDYAFNNLNFSSRNYLTFQGVSAADPDATTFLYNGPTVNPSYQPMWTFTDCQVLVFKNLAVNNRSIPRYGGLRFYHCKNVVWDNFHIYDDQPQGGATGVTTTDRYSIVFGFGGAPNWSDNLTFTNGIIENLQFEVDHAKNVVMQNLLVDGACCTGSLGNFSIISGSGNFCENWLIEDVVLNNPRHGNQGAFAFKLDATGISNCIYRNITLRRCTVNLDGRANGPLGAIAFGGPNQSGIGNVFDTITLEDVTINLADDADCVSKGAVDFLTATANWRFTNVILRRVRILAAVRSGANSIGIMARGLSGSVIEDCEVVNFATGIKCTVGMINTTIQNNKVQGCSTAYHLEGISTGNNFVGNEYAAPTGTPLVQVNVPPGNNIVAPTAFFPENTKLVAAPVTIATTLGVVLSEPADSIIESFDKADSSVLGPTFPWTKLTGNINIVSNKAQSTTLGAQTIARCDQDLSSVDQYVQATVNANEEVSGASVGLMLRKDDTATLTFYLFTLAFNSNLAGITKFVDGVATSVATASIALTAGTPVLLRGEANGTSLRLLVGGVETVTGTDSAVAGGLRTGLRGNKGGTGFVTWEDFEAGIL